MDTFTMRNFLHLCGSLSFSRTSRACNISPSALSRQIMRLEDEVGEKLFVRDNRRVVLTAVGQSFREYAAGTLSSLDRLTERVRARDGRLRGEISLYCSVTACYSVLPELLTAFRRSYPEIHIKLQTGDEANAISVVERGEADLCVAALPENTAPSLAFRVLTTTPLVFIAPKMKCPVSDLIACDPRPWDEIPLVLSEHGLARRRVDAWFRECGVTPRIYAQVSGNEAILAMVGLGCGGGVVPEIVVSKSPVRSVRTFTVAPELQPYTVVLCGPKRNLDSPIIRAFWELGLG